MHNQKNARFTVQLDRFIGIDFSGDKTRWGSRCSHPTVWIATVSANDHDANLDSLRPVQQVPGSGQPFLRLCDWLSSLSFAGAAIDAPFSIPRTHVPGSHQELLRQVSAIPEQPFPSGKQLLNLADSISTFTPGKKLFRGCDDFWRHKGVNTRSPLWNGPRPGAPFAAACMALLARTGLPCWPWYENVRPILVEAFPAAQLQHWGLPHKKCDSGTDSDGEKLNNRKRIVESLGPRIHFSSIQAEQMVSSPDALDAVVASFAARAVVKNKIAYPFPGGERLEGWIAIHL
jgi:Protein of unknown function (DUF429)